MSRDDALPVGSLYSTIRQLQRRTCVQDIIMEEKDHFGQHPLEFIIDPLLQLAQHVSIMLSGYTTPQS